MCVEKGKKWPENVAHCTKIHTLLGSSYHSKEYGQRVSHHFVCFLYYSAVVHLGSRTSFLCLIFLVFKRG